jgi:hypothetical protein
MENYLPNKTSLPNSLEAPKISTSSDCTNYAHFLFYFLFFSSFKTKLLKISKAPKFHFSLSLVRIVHFSNQTKNIKLDKIYFPNIFNLI